MLKEERKSASQQAREPVGQWTEQSVPSRKKKSCSKSKKSRYEGTRVLQMNQFQCFGSFQLMMAGGPSLPSFP